MARLANLLYLAVAVKYVVNILLLGAIVFGLYFGMKKNVVVTILVVLSILLFFGARNLPRSTAKNNSVDNRSEEKKEKIKKRLDNLNAVVRKLEKTKTKNRGTNYKKQLSFARFMVTKVELELKGNLMHKQSLIELRNASKDPH